jgi:hypothetical protein
MKKMGPRFRGDERERMYYRVTGLARCARDLDGR